MHYHSRYGEPFWFYRGTADVLIFAVRAGSEITAAALVPLRNCFSSLVVLGLGETWERSVATPIVARPPGTASCARHEVGDLAGEMQYRQPAYFLACESEIHLADLAHFREVFGVYVINEEWKVEDRVADLLWQKKVKRPPPLPNLSERDSARREARRKRNTRTEPVAFVGQRHFVEEEEEDVKKKKKRKKRR